MAGLSNRSNGKTVYLSVSKGKFQQRVDKESATSVRHTISKGVNTGQVVFYEQYDEIEGILTEVKTKTSQNAEFGKSWQFIMKVDDISYIIETPYSSSVASSIIRRLPNIDLTKEVKFAGFYLDEDKNGIKTGKKVQRVVLYQNKKKIDFAFTMAEPNGLPPLVKVKVKGVDTWDDTAQLEFFEKLVSETRFPKQQSEQAEESIEVDGDEIPF